MRKTYCATVNMPLCLCDFCFFSLICKELLWGEGGPVLPVAGLVHLSAHPARCHWGHSLPLWPGLLQQLAPHVSVPAPSLYLCHGCALAVNSALCCVPERRCATQTRSCARSATRGVKCGSYLTPARMPRYICSDMIVGSIFWLVCPHLRLFVSAGEPVVW